MSEGRLAALTSGATVADAASEAGFDRTTVHHRLPDDTLGALAILRGSGLLRGDRAPTGSEDPQTVARTAEADLARQQVELNLRRMINGLLRG